MSSLVTASEVRTYLQIAHADDDAWIAAIIPQVSAFVEGYTGRLFSSAARTEYHDGGGENLIARVPPIASITSITEDGGDGSVLDATDYDFDPNAGLVYLTSGEDWTPSRRYWELIYVGGYSAAPDDVKLFCLSRIAQLRDVRDVDTVQARLGDWSMSKDPAAQAGRALLDRYRLVAF